MLQYTNHYTEKETAKWVCPPIIFWPMLLDPHTKKYIARVLPHEIAKERLWKDVESTCVEILMIDFQYTER